jgi:transposase-like protein
MGTRLAGFCTKVDSSPELARMRRAGMSAYDDPEHAFPGHGQMKPEQLEIARLKREVTKLKAERDILKKLFANALRAPVKVSVAVGPRFT